MPSSTNSWGVDALIHHQEMQASLLLLKKVPGHESHEWTSGTNEELAEKSSNNSDLVAPNRNSSQASCGNRPIHDEDSTGETMLKSLTIKNFKCFESLQVDDLKRVNVIVGLNNSGKSNLLEAVHFLTAEDVVNSLHLSLGARELSWEVEAEEEFSTVFDLRHLFNRRSMNLGTKVSIAGSVNSELDLWNNPIDAIRSSIEILRPDQIASGSFIASIQSAVLNMTRAKACALFTFGKGRQAIAGFTKNRGIDESDLQSDFDRVEEPSPTRYVPTCAIDIETVADWWREIKLMEQEQGILSALRLIDAQIRKVDFPPLPKSRSHYYKSDVKVYLEGEETGSPVSLTSMGDGMWRILSLALSLVGQDLRYVLIDEIDTGLHYTVLPDMWRMVAKTAEARDVQVFATTHSKDCLEGLLRAAESDKEMYKTVSIIRLDPGASKASVISLEDYQHVHEFRGYPMVDDGGESKKQLDDAVAKYSKAHKA